MKTFFAAVGAILLLIILMVTGTGFYFYKKAGAGLGALSVAMTEDFLRKHHPNAHVVELLKRIENDAKLAQSLQQSTLAMAALSVLTLPDAVSAPQEAMLEEAATLLEKPGLSFADVNQFGEKYKDVLPKNGRHHRAEGAATPTPSDPNNVVASVEKQIELRIDAYKRRHQVDQHTAELFAKLQQASFASQKSQQTDTVVAAVTMVLFQPDSMTQEQQEILAQAAGLLENPNLTREQGVDLFNQAMVARHQDAAHRQHQAVHPRSR